MLNVFKKSVLSYLLVSLFLVLTACGGGGGGSSSGGDKNQSAAPTVTLAASGSTLNVSWTPVEKASGYKVYLAEQSITSLGTPSFDNHSSLTGSQVQSTNASVTTYTFSNLTINKTYYVLVQSIGNVNSVYANGQEKTVTIISAPTKVQFAKSGTDYKLTWKKPTGVNKFVVYTAQIDLSGKSITELNALLNSPVASVKTKKASVTGNEYTLTELNPNDIRYAAVVSTASNAASAPATSTYPKKLKVGQRFYKMAGHENNCVIDIDKNLIWEVKQTSGLHKAAHTYSWDSDSSTGTPNQGICKTSGAPAISCDTLGFITKVNQDSWCGFTDWRLPTGKSDGELYSLVKTDAASAAKIDTAFFPNTVADTYFSSTTLSTNNDRVHAVNFSNGGSETPQKEFALYVRLTRDR